MELLLELTDDKGRCVLCVTTDRPSLDEHLENIGEDEPITPIETAVWIEAADCPLTLDEVRRLWVVLGELLQAEGKSLPLATFGRSMS
jgi:hypothetical protein